MKMHILICGDRFVRRSLFKRKEYWHCTIRDTETGQVREISTRKKRRSEAETFVNRWCEEKVATEKAEAEGKKVVKRGKLFKVAYKEYLDLKDIRKSTRAEYQYQFDGVFKPIFGNCYIDEIQPKDIQKFLLKVKHRVLTGQKSKRKLSPRTSQKHLSALRSFFGWAMDNGYIITNPVTRNIRVRVPRIQRGIALTVDEAKKLLKAAREPEVLTLSDNRRDEWEQSFTPPEYLHDIIAIALLTGLRQSNVLNLRWKYIDLAERKLTIPADEMKAGVEHSMPVHKDVISILQKRLKGRRKTPGDELVLGDIPKTIPKSYKKALKRAKLPDMRFHDLRHTFGTWLEDLATEKVHRELMAHSTAGNVNMLYRHPPWEKKLATIDALEGILGEPEETEQSKIKAN